MSNVVDYLKIYDAVRSVPEDAQKIIRGGRLNGMTNINPMWRIKKLTEQFGACGFGWYYDIKKMWLENSMASDEIVANVEIDLYVKIGDEWSKPIRGVGGSMFLAQEKNGLHTDDEAYKKALTDAISVACKALGMGADIYWDSDSTKYDRTADREEVVRSIKERETWRWKVLELALKKGISNEELSKDYNLTKSTTAERFKEVYKDLGGE